MNGKRRQRTVYLVTIAAMLAMIGGYALAATTVTTLSPQQTSNVTQSPSPGGFGGIASIVSEQLVVLSSAMTTSSTAGTQTSGAVGLEGTPTALTACTTTPCSAQNFRTASPSTQTAGDFGEQIVLNVFQSAANSGVGFDMAVTLQITVGVVSSSVVALGYLTVPTSATTATIPTFLFIDLNTSSAPVINSVSVVFNQCSTGTSCP